MLAFFLRAILDMMYVRAFLYASYVQLFFGVLCVVLREVLQECNRSLFGFAGEKCADYLRSGTGA